MTYSINVRGRVLVCVGVVCAWGALPRRGAAEEPGRVLVLPVDTIGRFRDPSLWRSEFFARLTAKLRDARFSIVSDRLSSTEAVCRERACLAQLAAGHRVDWVVGAKVVNDERVPPTFHVEVWAFNTKSTREIKRSYPNGSESEAADGLEKQLGEALTPPAPPPAPEVTASPPAPAPVAAPPPVERTPMPLRWHKPLYLSLAAVGAAGFVAGTVAFGVKAAQNGKDACSSSFPVGRTCPLVRNTTAGMAVSGAVALASLGVAIAGTVLSVRERKAPARQAWILPSSDGRAVFVYMGGGF